jgi:trehalose 6-phosphate phosphatase
MKLQRSHGDECLALPHELPAFDAKSWALFLDVDGTLLDIAPTPELVRVPADLAELLVHLSRALGGALAILTGRQLAEIDTLLDPARFAGAGVHGAELRTDPAGPIARVATALPPSLIGEVTEIAATLPGIIVEPKGPGLAVHYRLAPHLKAAVERNLRLLLARYGESLVLCPGRKLFEIVPAGHSKGTALATISALPAFSGRRPLMIGDDVGDEPAILVAERLGGAGLRVGGEHFGAAGDLAGPAEVVALLRRLKASFDT